MLFSKSNSIIRRTFKHHSFLEIVLVIFIFVMICNYLFKLTPIDVKEGFTQNKDKDKTVTIYRGNELFDDFYVSIYDKLVLDDNKLKVEIYEVLNNINKNDPFNVLDIGCSTGHHINSFSAVSDNAVGVDISPSMIKKAKKNYPSCNFKVGDAHDIHIAKPNSLTHVNCVYFTIYYLHDQDRFFKNCHEWLEPGGKLILHTVDPEKFDPIVSAADPFQFVKPQHYTKKRITETEVEFNNYNYKAKFNYYKDEDKASFQEKITDKTTKNARLNEHVLYMPPISKLLTKATNAGFIIKNKSDLKKYDYDHQYLYTLQKST